MTPSRSLCFCPLQCYVWAARSLASVGLPILDRRGYTPGVGLQVSTSDNSARRIGKYELLGELGHGGMAVVYRARDTQLLREVAIKVLHPHLASDPECRRRFLREAQAAARLRHPNIVEVYDFSLEGDQESFMVSELLEGPTLRRFAEEHPGMPAEIAAAIGIVLCDALACAHREGVIHRDVKPDNILLHKGGILKLTDFGIAHLADGNAMTVTGQILGSPAHMAPEQIEGRDVDPRTDLFAMGTVLYALAVGRLPFEAPHPHALLRKILEVEYPDPIRVAPAVGHRFAAIVRKCLERDPDQRYPDATALRQALLDFVGEVGWTQPETQLKAYFEDPDGFTARHREQLLQILPERGVQARRAGNLPDALGYFNRALALDPTNARVLSLVRGISRTERIRKTLAAVGIVTAAALASGAAVLTIARRVRSSPTSPTATRTRAVSVQPAPTERREPAVTPAPLTLSAHAATPSLPGVDAAGAGNTTPTVVGRAAVASAIRVSTRTVHHGASTPRTEPQASSTTPTGIRGSTDAGTDVPLRSVLLIVHPQGVSVSVDNQQPFPYQGRRPIQLRPGRHEFRIIPTDASCEEQAWSQDIPPDPQVLRIVRRLRCRPGSGMAGEGVQGNGVLQGGAQSSVE